MNRDKTVKNKNTALADNIASEHTVTDDELALINKYTRRQFTSDEVYVFSVVLCDNDIDRDYERFTVEALFELEKLFVGKTGILDHNPSASNQTARIFDCRVEAVAGKKTKTGDDYFRLTARAYMPKSEQNSELILSLDSGITKEVSVGCAVGKTVCSICSEDMSSHLCSHKKGESYNGNLCYGMLCEPYDAYEWSFVAVPAQPKAGVIKSYKKKTEVTSLTEILKALETKETVTLDSHQSEKLCGYIAQLKEKAQQGEMYCEQLRKSILSLTAVAEPDIPYNAMAGVVKKMSIDELVQFEKYYKGKLNSKPLSPQLCSEKKAVAEFKNNEFKI